MQRGDLIEEEGTRYIVVSMAWHDGQDTKFMAWDFKAWSEGYYDAYLGIDLSEEEIESHVRPI